MQKRKTILPIIATVFLTSLTGCSDAEVQYEITSETIEYKQGLEKQYGQPITVKEVLSNTEKYDGKKVAIQGVMLGTSAALNSEGLDELGRIKVPLYNDMKTRSINLWVKDMVLGDETNAIAYGTVTKNNFMVEMDVDFYKTEVVDDAE